jgi:hypothetical protein
MAPATQVLQVDGVGLMLLDEQSMGRGLGARSDRRHTQRAAVRAVAVES